MVLSLSVCQGIEFLGSLILFSSEIAEVGLRPILPDSSLSDIHSLLGIELVCRHTEVESSETEGAGHDSEEDLSSLVSCGVQVRPGKRT